MKKNIFILLLMLLIIACQKDTTKPTIDRQTYKNILKEIILTNVVKEELNNKNILSKNWLSLIYQKYQIDSLILEKTTEYYSQHPEELQKIYNEIYLEIKKTYDSLKNLEPPQSSKPTNEKIKISKKKLSEITKKSH